MIGSGPDVLPPPLGRKVEPVPPAPVLHTGQKWTPLRNHPGYERDLLGNVRKAPGTL